MAVWARIKTIFAGDLPAITTPIPPINTEFNVVGLSTIVAYKARADVTLIKRNALSAAICSAILTEKHLAAWLLTEVFQTPAATR